ncbi:MAG: bifunctional oligoribonuclease/PAP phosphatase NrnA [Spirochaetota bacterium]
MTLEQAAGYIRTFNNFVLASHDGPDADGLGAAYALGVVLESLGKKAQVLLFEAPPPKLSFIDRRGYFGRIMEGAELPFPASGTCAIVVDTHDFAYLGGRMEALINQAKGIILLDHHEAKGSLDEKYCVDPTKSSTCEMVWILSGLLGATLPLDAAEAIYAGIVYDTGSFAYPKTTEGTFECARELVKIGVQPYTMHNRVYESASTSSLLLQKIVFGSLELRLGNKLAFQVLTQADLARAGAVYEDAEDLVNIPLKGGEIEVSVLIKEKSEGKYRCSLRSKGNVNVARVAQGFGGGGHKTAAGFTSTSPLEALKALVLQNVEQGLSETTA